MIVAALDALLAEDHQARVVWAFVDKQDLSALYEQIRATGDSVRRRTWNWLRRSIRKSSQVWR